MNATIAKELIEHIRTNINEDIPNVGVIKALLEDAVSYLEYPIIPEVTSNRNVDWSIDCIGELKYHE